MRYMYTAISGEMLKLQKSPIIFIVAILFTLAPLMAGFFTFILQDPQFAKNAGLLGDKAQIIGDASAPSYIAIHAQMIAVGGFIAYAFVTSWLFGREYTDRTIIDLCMLPFPRSFIVVAKFIAMFITNTLLTLYILLVGFLIGITIGVEQFTFSYFVS